MFLPSLRFFARRSILLLVALAMLALTLISLAGMSVSVMVVENVQGNASAINVAGGLRRLAHRVASFAATDLLVDDVHMGRLAPAIAAFEDQLVHPSILHVLQRAPDGLFAATYRGVEATWRLSIKPRLAALGDEGEPAEAAQIETLLIEVDAFVDQLDTLVKVLEHGTEASIQDLRSILALAIALTMAVILVVLFMLQRSLHRPLAELGTAAERMARGDFSARAAHTGHDELGRLGLAFNRMADELSKLYRDLELRVEAKTAELQRSTRSLEVLYHAIARLYHNPAAAEAYHATLRDLEQALGLAGSLACIEPRHDGPAALIASTLGPCPDRLAAGDAACARCRAAATAEADVEEGSALLRVPLRDREHHYGTLRLALPASHRLEDWQRQLVEALSRHIGMALGAARRGEQARLLALQEERSVIARELHDSLAQDLSYMKIQVSLLQPVLADPARAAEAGPILADLRQGLNAAYRQLRELLVSFRLRMTGDLHSLLQATVEEFRGRGGLAVELSVRLADCALSPNQEVHVLQIVREALSNMARHAGATRAQVSLHGDAEGRVTVTVDDDGTGFPAHMADGCAHHGLAIMRERARTLGAQLRISASPDGGARVRLRFRAATGMGAAPAAAAEVGT
jgi:two-component system nitrate/nitrite sensor histidine kinase NarX